MGQKNRKTSGEAKAAAKAKAAIARKQKAKKGFKIKPQYLVSILVVFCAFGISILTSSSSPTDKADNVQYTSALTKADILQRARDAPCNDRQDAARCADLVYVHGCDSAPGWMAVMCAASCGRCDLLDPKIRCDPARLNVSTEPAYKPGDMDAMFEGLGEKYPQYNVKYLRRPPEGPWIVSFENFLSDFEVQAMIEQAGELKRSTDQGEVEADGFQNQVVSDKRTSSNAWCQYECEQNDTVIEITNRIEQVTQVPSENYESFQLLRYNIGQEYKTHHDMSPNDNEMVSGPRILTFFLYLSDVEEGGGTRFPNLDVTMEPKKGSAILWPSTLNEDPTKQDIRTLHQALPVIKGTKYAANQWIHLYNYKVPNIWGCTGAFT